MRRTQPWDGACLGDIHLESEKILNLKRMRPFPRHRIRVYEGVTDGRLAEPALHDVQRPRGGAEEILAVRDGVRRGELMANQTALALQ